MPRPVILGPDGEPLKPEKIKTHEELREEYLANATPEQLRQDYIRYKAGAEAMEEARAEVDALCDCEVSKELAAGGTGWDCPRCGKHTHALVRAVGAETPGVCWPCWHV